LGTSNKRKEKLFFLSAFIVGEESRSILKRKSIFWKGNMPTTEFVSACSHKKVSSTTSFWTNGLEEPLVLCESCYFYHLSSKDFSSESRLLANGFFSGIQASISSVWFRAQRLTRERRIVRSIKQCDYYEQPNCVLPGQLYLGSQYSACHLETLRKLNISAVLVCGNSLPRFFMERPDSSIEYHKLPIHDSVDQPLLPYIHSAIQFLETNILVHNKGVLVHCAAGVSRSASMVIAYLMKRQRWDYDTARQFVWEKRPIINPNPRFEKELRCRWYPLCVPPDEDKENFYSLPRISSLTPPPSVSDSISEPIYSPGNIQACSSLPDEISVIANDHIEISLTDNQKTIVDSHSVKSALSGSVLHCS
jgi:hypothetical protein